MAASSASRPKAVANSPANSNSAEATRAASWRARSAGRGPATLGPGLVTRDRQRRRTAL